MLALGLHPAASQLHRHAAVAQVALVTFSLPAGPYTGSRTVSLACATAGAAIHYTLDGSTPNTSSPTYTIGLLVAVSTTIKAEAFKAGLLRNGVAIASYTIS